jgi:hypothetical protein
MTDSPDRQAALRDALLDFVALLPPDRWALLRPETQGTVDREAAQPAPAAPRTKHQQVCPECGGMNPKCVWTARQAAQPAPAAPEGPVVTPGEAARLRQFHRQMHRLRYEGQALVVGDPLPYCEACPESEGWPCATLRLLDALDAAPETR